MKAINNLLNENVMNSEVHNINSFSQLVENIQGASKDQQEARFQCPMNCEGNKTYNQPGECPVCNMQLLMVGQDEPRIRIE